LSRAGMIAQVRRGLYLVPERLPLGGRWSPDEGLALNTLFDAINGRYQICGPNAFNRYDFDEQVPTRVYVYNNLFDFTLGTHPISRKGTTELGRSEATKRFWFCLH
jgi:hypothetical protein